MRYFLQSAAFSLAALAALTFATPTALAQEDVTPPTLLAVSLEPKVIDTSEGAQTITVTIHVADDLSGVELVALRFRKRDTTQDVWVEFRPAAMWNHPHLGYLLSGDDRNGWYSNTMTVPQYAAFGEWEMYYVSLHDNVGNRSDLWKRENESDSDWPSHFNNVTFWVGPEPALFRLLVPALSREE